MKPLLIYLLQVIIASAILYGYYHIALRNKRFHQYNRFYILASVFISILIPFLNIPVYFNQSQVQSFAVLQTLEIISYSPPAAVNEIASSPVLPVIKESFNWNALLYIAYATIAFILLLRILLSLIKIRIIIKRNTVEELDGVHFINTTEPGTPYSFFRWLFWNKKIELRSENGEHIFRHEIFHIQQKHSLDRITMEILTVFFWINPFFHLMKKELKAIHEFLADQFAVHESQKWEYAELLLMQAFNTQHQLVNPFFHNQIKRRIAMITNPKKTSHRYLRKLLVLPVAAMVVTLFAFKYKSRNEAPPVPATETITIVVDAAHGGIDAGAVSVNRKYTEAQITLELAKTIQKLASEYNVNVVMTRENENLPGNVSTIDEGLKKRVQISELTKPAAFISLHVNAIAAVIVKGDKIDATVNKDAETGFALNASGFEAYVTAKNDPRSNQLASSILQNVSSLHTTKTKPLQRKQGGIYVLDKNKYPSVVLECGYLTNEKDLDFITNAKNQEKIARSILAGIVAYSNNKKEETATTSVSPETDNKKEELSITSAGQGTENKKEKSLTTSASAETDTIPLITGASEYANALIVIDGKIKVDIKVSELDQTIKIENIETIMILKGKSATDKYGEKGKYGVIEISTKEEYAKKKDLQLTDVKVEELTNVKVEELTDVKVEENKIFTQTEIDPVFPGGNGAWLKYLEKNIDPSLPEKNNAPAGSYTVWIQFIVRKDGSIADIKPLTNHGFGMEQEAVRVVKAGPKWVPGIQGGKTVNAYTKQHIDFITGKIKITNVNLPLEKVRTLEQDKTTSADIKSLFGEPTYRDVDNNAIAWTYEGQNATLSIQFNRNNESISNFKFIAVTNGKSDAIDYEKAKRLKENETTFSQLEDFFGKPTQVNISNSEEAWFYDGSNSRLSVMSTNRKSGVINFFSYRN